MPTSVPTSEEFEQLSERVEAIASAPVSEPVNEPAPSEPVFVTEWPHTAFQKDNTEAALRAAVNEMLNTRKGANATRHVQMAPGRSASMRQRLSAPPCSAHTDRPPLPAITVYVKPSGCQGCTITKKILDAAGVAYAAVDVTTDADAYSFITETLGFQQVPVVHLDGRAVKDGKGLPVSAWHGLRPDLLNQLKEDA